MNNLVRAIIFTFLYYTSSLFLIILTFTSLEWNIWVSIIVGTITYFLIFAMLTSILLAIYGEFNITTTPLVLMECLFGRYKFKKMHGEFFKNVWVIFEKDKLRIIEIKTFYIKEISVGVKYDHNTPLQQLIESETQNYVSEKREEKERRELIENWGGYADKKSSRNGKINEVLGKKP